MEEKEIKKDDYTVRVGYSDKAKKDKLLKFITKSGDEFEISAEELADMIVGGVNTETLDAAFVEVDKVNVVEVGRQLEAVLTEDMKKGQKIRMNYSHPYPVEFAIIEQTMGIAKINMDVPITTLTKEYIEEVKSKITSKQENFITKFYKSFKNIKLAKKGKKIK